MNIRSMTKADYDHVVGVFDRWWGGPAGERAHPVFFYELGQRALVAEKDDSVIGFLLGFIAEGAPTTAYAHLLGIDPEYRRKGVGRALYAHFEQACAKAGCGRMKAITTVGNEGSLQFHLALGFSAVEHPSYAGEGRSRLVFTKALGGA